MPRIGIDATVISSRGKGLSRYQKNMLNALSRLETGHEYFIFHRKEESLALEGKTGFQGIPVKFSRQIFWEQFSLPGLAKSLKLDLVYTLYDKIPFFSSVPFIAHIFEIPDYRMRVDRGIYPRVAGIYQRLSFVWTLKKAALILASSEFTKQDLVKKFSVPENRIKVLFGAAEDCFKPADAHRIQRVRERETAGCPYLLHFASGDFRENTAVLLKAFSGAVSRMKNKVKLILVGEGSREFNIADPQLNALVVRKGYVPDPELLELYQAASLYVDPSLYEGLGFQPLEAMACGVPLIVSNRTSFPEIVEQAGIYVDPENVSYLSEAMEKVLEDAQLEQKMRRLSLEQAKKFEWTAIARKLLSCFDEVLTGHSEKGLAA